jgi:hypothetical protein
MLPGYGGACQGAGVVCVVVRLSAGGVVLVVGAVVLFVSVGVVVFVLDVAPVVVVVVVVGAVLVAVVVAVVVRPPVDTGGFHRDRRVSVLPCKLTS